MFGYWKILTKKNVKKKKMIFLIFDCFMKSIKENQI